MRHPDQNIYTDKHGTHRFEQNKIVRYLVDALPGGLNSLAIMPFSNKDRRQLAQLIGYSIDGWADLSYVRSKDTERVDAEIEQ